VSERIQLGLTPRQADVLQFVRDYIGQRGCSPSMAEISAALKCSPPSACRLLQRLEKRGAIIRDPRLHRSITLAAA